MQASRQTVREQLHDHYDLAREHADEIVDQYVEAIDDAERTGDSAEFVAGWIVMNEGLAEVRYEWLDEHGRIIREASARYDEHVDETPETTRATTLRISRGEHERVVHR